ncbi:hypothetical protein NMY22_g14027 [Coprinellus aureogranulatus]|nr:hypothetical protein NMY22_g14027 [Coprinellus aureogranulatus]
MPGVLLQSSGTVTTFITSNNHTILPHGTVNLKTPVLSDVDLIVSSKLIFRPDHYSSRRGTFSQTLVITLH